MSVMKQYALLAFAGLALGGCVSPYGWSEAPMDDRYYAVNGSVPVDWWGSDAASVDVFYGALAGQGNWASHDRYGRVFLPAGVGSGWQPYSRGYWREDPRRGRMWVSSEPWGWATYHYGRWGHDSRFGWFWVPDTRFGPGWVDWQSANGYASWAPIPPYGWSNWGYGYGNNWWVTAPGSWAYRPGMYNYLRPGRHGWNGRDDWRDRPPSGRPDHPRRDRPSAEDVAGNVVRGQFGLPRQQADNGVRQRPSGTRPPGTWQQTRPDRGQAIAPPRQPQQAQQPRPTQQTQQQTQGPRPERPQAAAPPRQDVSRAQRGSSGSGSRETRGRDVSPRTVDK
jgi:hypothetical protein